MATTNTTMKRTMETMLRNYGYVAKANIVKDGFTLTFAAMPDRATMILKYPTTMTPGEVVFAARSTLDRLNGK